MGVDCRVYLPPTAKTEDIIDVFGALVGCKKEQRPLGYGHSGSYTVVLGVKARRTDIPTLVEIDISHPNAQKWGLSPYLHMECVFKPGWKLVSMRSSAPKLAIARRLVRFFGGRLNYCDYNDEINFTRRPRFNTWDTEDGEGYRRMQDAIMGVKPVTEKEIAECEQWAAYKAGE